MVEDEMIVADNICNTLQELSYQPLEPAISYTEALATIERDKPDIAILDVQLSGKKTGIDIARKINEKYNIPFIFLTANSDPGTVNKAKEVKPNAYLVKPFSKDELYTSIEIAIHNFINTEKEEIEKKSIFIKEKGAYIQTKFDDILYIKSSHVYIEIFLKNKQKFVLRTSLKEFLNKLDKNFMRVHRGYVVNLSHIKEINQNTIKVSETELPIGNKYREFILKKINLV